MKKIISIFILVSLLFQMILPEVTLAMEIIENNQNTSVDEKNQYETEEKDSDTKEIEKEEMAQEESETQEEMAQKEENEIQEKEEQEEQEEKIKDEILIITPSIQPLVGENKDDSIEFDDVIKNALFNYGYDQNNDGKFSIEELESNSNDYLPIYLQHEEINYTNLDYDEIDFSNMEYLKNIKHLAIYNFIGSLDLSKLSKMNNLQRLELSGYMEEILAIESIPNLEELTLNCYGDNSLNSLLQQIKNLSKLETLNISGGRYSIIIDYTPLQNMQNLKELNLSYTNTQDLTGIENLTNLKKLEITSLGEEYPCDTDTISKITSLTSLSIRNFYENIEWLESIENLRNLHIDNYCYNDKIFEIDNEYIDTINKLNLESFQLTGEVTINLGELETGKKIEKTFDSVPILKETSDKTSIFYNDGYEINLRYYENGSKYIEIDNENKKLYVTPLEENAREAIICLDDNNSLNAKLIWTVESDNNGLVFGKTIQDKLLEYGVDKNGDGIITKIELNNYMGKYETKEGEIEYSNLTNLSIYANYNENIDLTGIEYIESIDTIYLSGISTYTDLTPLKKLKNLKTLYISGSQIDISPLKDLTRN